MIQRVQTLFLLQLVFLSVSLLFVPVQFIDGFWKKDYSGSISLLPASTSDFFLSTAGHYAVVALNMLGIAIAFVTIFLFKKRELQVKLCYLLVLIYLVITLMIAFCPMVQQQTGYTLSDIKTNIFSYIICSVCIFSALLAIRFIKKDITLLKSADRIR